ncbi:MAG: hypothetical protein OXG72_00805, partial [Acidobacteria bacterium]|nr:hypothetical protein [Acidobacteriota bacterium]
RLRLLTAQGAFDAARELAAALDSVAAERDLVRTRMRGLALAMVLKHRAGEAARVRAHLVAYLRLFDATGYARPLAREGELALTLLDRLAKARKADAAVAGAAARLRAILDAEAEAQPSETPLSDGELEVLALLEEHHDKAIATRLDLTFHGVRHRVSRIFAKLGVRGRLDAVRRGRERGLLPPAAGG